MDPDRDSMHFDKNQIIDTQASNVSNFSDFDISGAWEIFYGVFFFGQ